MKKYSEHVKKQLENTNIENILDQSEYLVLNNKYELFEYVFNYFKELDQFFAPFDFYSFISDIDGILEDKISGIYKNLFNSLFEFLEFNEEFDKEKSTVKKIDSDVFYILKLKK